MDTVLAGETGGDGEYRVFVAQNRLADAQDAGGDGKRSITFAGDDFLRGLAHTLQQFFTIRQVARPSEVEQGDAGDTRPAPDRNLGISMLADDKGFQGAGIDPDLL